MSIEKIFIYLTILNFIISCSTVPSVKPVYQTSNIPGFEPEKKHFNKIIDKISQCYDNDKVLADYWLDVIKIPLDSYIIFDDEMADFLDQKAKEYVNITHPRSIKIIHDGYNLIGSVTTKSDFFSLAHELTVKCIGDHIHTNILKEVISKAVANEKSFFDGINKKAKYNAEENYNKLNLVVQGEDTNILFYNVYINLFKYAEQEKIKLDLL